MEKNYPNVNDFVIAKIVRINEYAAYAELIEYNNIEGMLMFSDITRKKMKTVAKFIRIGKNEILKVLRVDREKGYIDLSKIDINEDDIEKFMFEYKKRKLVKKIFSNIQNSQEIIEKLNSTYSDKFDNIYDIIQYISEYQEVLSEVLKEFDKDVVKKIQKNIKIIFESKIIKETVLLQITCFSYHGIDGIKESIKFALSEHSKRNPNSTKKISITLKNSPEYYLTYEGISKDIINSEISNVVKDIQKCIKLYGGDCLIFPKKSEE